MYFLLTCYLDHCLLNSMQWPDLMISPPSLPRPYPSRFHLFTFFSSSLLLPSCQVISLLVLILQATFFITYVLTGWVGLCSEIMQIFALIYTFVRRYICQLDDDPQLVPTFPYHTEIPKVLLYSLLGFTCSILAPLILPFLLVYFCLGYVVYRNQVIILKESLMLRVLLEISIRKMV